MHATILGYSVITQRGQSNILAMSGPEKAMFFAVPNIIHILISSRQFLPRKIIRVNVCNMYIIVHIISILLSSRYHLRVQSDTDAYIQSIPCWVYSSF